MSKNLNALALRRRSIRTLSPSELRAAHGGRGTGTCGTTAASGCTGRPTQTK